jgi:hypothetical protein
MRLAMPFVWEEGFLAQDPGNEVCVGIAMPAAETATRIEAIRTALIEAEAPQLAAVPHHDGALRAVHEPSSSPTSGRSFRSFVNLGRATIRPRARRYLRPAALKVIQITTLIATISAVQAMRSRGIL